MSPEVERTIGLRARKGDIGARNRLVESNLGLAVKAATRTGMTGADLDDLIQEGALALLYAASRWDPHRGVRFATYAWTCAVRAVSRSSYLMAVPLRRPDRSRKLLSRRGSARLEREKVARGEQVRGTASDQLADNDPDGLLALTNWRAESLEVADLTRESPEDALLADVERSLGREGHSEAEVSVAKLLVHAELTEKQTEAVRLRFGLDGPQYSTTQVAGLLGISPSAVSQRIRAAITRLQATPLGGVVHGRFECSPVDHAAVSSQEVA